MSEQGKFGFEDGRIKYRIYQAPDHALDGKVKWFDASKGYGFIEFDEVAGSKNEVKIVDYFRIEGDGAMEDDAGDGKLIIGHIPVGYKGFVKATVPAGEPKVEIMDEVFVHKSAIVGKGYKALREGDRVRFSLTGDKGIQASNVVVIQEG